MVALMATSSPPPRRLTVAEAAGRLGCSKSVIYQLIGTEIEAIRVGRDYRITETSLDEYIERQTIKPPRRST